MSRGMYYGVATNQYGSGMVITHRTPNLHDAEVFAAGHLLGSVAICRFSDGRWRNIADPASERRVEEARQARVARLVGRKPQAPGWLADGVRHP